MKQNNLYIKLGKDGKGNYFSYDLSQMHHLLIGGIAGSGKTQFIHNTILQITENNSPKEIKFIMFDGNGVDLNIYSKIPHMYVPVINEVIKFRGMLKWLDSKQDEILDILKKENLKTTEEYNEKYGKTVFPKIIVVINELGNLVKDYTKIQETISKIIRFARYSGIYFIAGTSTEIAGLGRGYIVANIPSRIAFKTKDARASRLLLYQNGAERLNGKGDMLFISPVSIGPIRLQGDEISEKDLKEKVTELEKKTPIYNEELLDEIERSSYGFSEKVINRAIEILKEEGKIRTSSLMVGLKISYAKASKILDILEEKEIVSKVDPITKRREFFIKLQCIK